MRYPAIGHPMTLSIRDVVVDIYAGMLAAEDSIATAFIAADAIPRLA